MEDVLCLERHQKKNKSLVHSLSASIEILDQEYFAKNSNITRGNTRNRVTLNAFPVKILEMTTISEEFQPLFGEFLSINLQ